MDKEKISAENEDCHLILDFLVSALDGKTFGDQLMWVPKRRGVFQMKWTHKSKQSWCASDCAVFMAWDEKKGRSRPVTSQDFVDSKQRLRAALRTNKKIKEVETVRGYRKYRFTAFKEKKAKSDGKSRDSPVAKTGGKKAESDEETDLQMDEDLQNTEDESSELEMDKSDDESTDLQMDKTDDGSTDLQMDKTDDGNTDLQMAKADAESTDGISEKNETAIEESTDSKIENTVDKSTDKMEWNSIPEEMMVKSIKREIDSDSETYEGNKENSSLPSKKHKGQSNGLDTQPDVEDESEKVELNSDIKGNVQLFIQGATDDDDEEYIIMTKDEIKEYLLKKVGEKMLTRTNPWYYLQCRSHELEEKMKTKTAEFSKFIKVFDMLHRSHEKFLRFSGVLPKIPSGTVSVAVDLPVLVSNVPKPAPPSLTKNELSITKVETPITTNTSSTNGSPASTNQSNLAAKPAVKPSNIEFIDLTDEIETTSANNVKRSSFAALTLLKHPAPLPPRPQSRATRFPPKPRLKIFAEERGIVLQWDMAPNLADPIASFEIYGYQEQKNMPINTLLWKKIGAVKAMNLPMACTLTQFVEGNKYHFAIRALDINAVYGHYSDAISIVYNHKTSVKK